MTAAHHRFGLTTLVCVVIAGMIGAGVFTTSGYSILSLGSPAMVLAAWVIGGVVAICGAIAYGGLARQLPESGGEYLYLTRRLHPFAGFLTGWISLTAGFSGSIALAAVTFEEYVIPDRWRLPWPAEHTAAMLVVVVCGLGHGLWIRRAADIQNLIVMVKLLALTVFLLFAAGNAFDVSLHWNSIPPAADPSSAVQQSPIYAMATSVMWISLSYVGFNSAIYVASEVANAETIVPRAILIGTISTTALYLLLNFFFVTAVPAEQIAGHADVAAVAAKAIGGDRLGILIRVTIGLATFSSVAGMIMTGPRIYGRMADDGWLPAWYRSGPKLIPRTVLLQTGLALILIRMTTFRQLLSYLGTTLSLSSAITVSTLLFGCQTAVVGRIQKTAALVYVTATMVFVVLMSIGDIRQLYATLITLAAGTLCYQVAVRYR